MDMAVPMKRVPGGYPAIFNLVTTKHLTFLTDCSLPYWRARMASKYWLKLFHETIYDPKIMMRSPGARLLGVEFENHAGQGRLF